MTQQQVPQPTRPDRAPQLEDLLRELDEQRQRDQDAAQRQAEQEQRDRELAEAEASLDALNAEIEGLLSLNSEEFVIRFIQTVGQ